MEPDFSKLFHKFSKDNTRGRPHIPTDDKDWPEEWKTTQYKKYLRLPKIDLPHESISADFFDLIKKRQSRRDFTRNPITKRELSILLQYSCGETSELGNNRYRRAQPSGGARFPIEIYPIIFRDGLDLDAGLYHYDVKEHALNVLWDRKFSDKDIGELFTYPWVKEATIGLVMTAVFRRNQNKYGERGYRYILLEAGHVGQNVSLVAEALNLKCCALGGTKDESIEKLIDIDGVNESVVYGFAIGR